jgi:ferredoxin
LAVRISEDCVNCAACEPTCPNDAIRPGDEFYEVSRDRCTECLGFYDAPQCVGVCPTEAIGPDPEAKESQDELLARYRCLHLDRPPEKLETWQPVR